MNNRVLVVTPCVPGGLPTQGSIIAGHLSHEGVRVTVLSRASTSVGRLLDVCLRVFGLAARHPVLLVDVFGERAFVYESVAILCGALLRRRVVVMLHNGMMPGFVQRWPRWTRFVLSKAEVVLTPHGFLRDRLSAAGIRIDGSIPNFISLEPYTYHPRQQLLPHFLYMRGMDPVYNPEMALRAFALIQARYPEASLTMVGRDGPSSQPCRALVSDLGLRQVEFRGLVSKDEIGTLAAGHDIHLHTNRFDNMPVTILEMWACGLPVVGTNVGGMPYLVRHGVDGILVPSDDHEAMADACLQLLRDPARAGRLSASGRRRVEDLTWAHIRPLWESVLSGGESVPSWRRHDAPASSQHGPAAS